MEIVEPVLVREVKARTASIVDGVAEGIYDTYLHMAFSRRNSIYFISVNGHQAFRTFTILPRLNSHIL